MTLFAIVFVVLLVLKLAGAISVSWWLVAAPLIVEAALDLLFLVFAGGVAALIAWRGTRRR